MKRLTYISYLAAAALLAASQSQAQTSVLAVTGAPGQTQLEVDYSGKYIDFSEAGGKLAVDIKTNTVAAAAADGAWCKAEVADGGIIVTADPNDEEEIREATLTISALDGLQATFTVRQLGVKPGFLVKEDTVNVAGVNSRVLLNITANANLDFSLPDWITPVDDASETGAKTYIFLAGQMNNGARDGEITVSLADGGLSSKVCVTQTFDGFPAFFVISDTHFGDGNAKERVTRSISSLYDADHDVDAIFVNGDLTNSGALGQYEEFKSVLEDESLLPAYVERHYVMGNHEWFAGESAMDNYAALGQELQGYFDIKGYPFIYAGLSGSNEQDYSEDTYKFLRKSLADAAVRYAGRPVFVFTHIPVYGTTHGSGDSDGGWGNHALYDIFKDYPQIIHFCGHTHFSLRDPKALWQGAFTSIDDGTNNYCYLNPGIDVDGSTPDGVENVQEGVIVKVEDLSNVNIRRIDGRRGEEIEPAWNIPAPYDGSNMTYASYAGGEAPRFTDPQVNTRESQSDGRVITFTQAEDDDIVLYYKTAVLDESGDTLASGNKCSGFYLGSDMPENVSITLSGLPAGKQLHAEVVACDPYGNVSEPAKSEPFTVGSYTPAPGTTAPEPDLLDLKISDYGVPLDATGTSTIEKSSIEPVLFTDKIYQRNAARFQNNSSQYYKVDYTDNSKIPDAMLSEITYEALFRCNSLSSAWKCPLSSMDVGGQGIELDAGEIAFYVGTQTENGNVYKSVATGVTATPGQYFHVVATYSKAEDMIRVYVNGFPAGEVATEGEPNLPRGDDAHWMAIGGDAKSGGTECDGPFDGDILVARLYSRAVTRDEAYCMYRIWQDVADANQGGEDEPPVETAPEADLMDIKFGENGAAEDVSPLATEVRTGGTVPQTYFNETYGLWTAKFGGADNQEYYAVPYGTSGTIYDAMSGSFSLEALAVINNPDEYGSDGPCVVSSQQHGGFGIEHSGDIGIFGSFAGEYLSVSTGIDIEPGRFYHIIGVVDYDNYEMRVYVDGKLAGSVPTVGSFDYPEGNAQYFCIGGDASASGEQTEFMLNGEIALVRMYGHALTLGEAKKLYNDLQPAE